MQYDSDVYYPKDRFLSELETKMWRKGNIWDPEFSGGRNQLSFMFIVSISNCSYIISKYYFTCTLYFYCKWVIEGFIMNHLSEKLLCITALKDALGFCNCMRIVYFTNVCVSKKIVKLFFPNERMKNGNQKWFVENLNRARCKV